MHWNFICYLCECGWCVSVSSESSIGIYFVNYMEWAKGGLYSYVCVYMDGLNSSYRIIVIYYENMWIGFLDSIWSGALSVSNNLSFIFGSVVCSVSMVGQ